MYRNLKKVIKRLIRKIYPLWVLFLVYRKVYGTFKAIYYGLRKNEKSLNNVFNLRRGIHRLEKGLSFSDQKEVFAESYIASTVKLLKNTRDSNILDKKTKYWAVAVLSRYFEIVEHTEIIKGAFREFESLDIANNKPEEIPYNSSDRPACSITYKELLQLAKRRRSTRFFFDKTVEPKMIEEAMKVAAYAPSACNRQSYRFLFFNEEEKVNKIASIPGGVSGYWLPSIIVIVGRYAGYFDERDMFVPFIDASLAAMSFQFALETLGLSSVSINWQQQQGKDEQIRDLIDIDDDECVVMMMGVGYPDPEGKIPYSSKRSVKDLLSINENF